MTSLDRPTLSTPFVIASSPQSFDAACHALEQAISSHGFGLLGSHDLGSTLRNKGEAFQEECRIYEVCHPGQAARVLASDLRLNMALPCRLSVYSEAGRTQIGMISPVALLAGLNTDPHLAEVAAEVETSLRAIINDAAADC